MASRRRTRYKFVATHPSGKEGLIDVLAYSREGAVKLLEAKGYYNYVLQPKTRNVSARSAAKWRKNERAIREAIEFFDIKLPVLIKITGHEGGRYGAHWLDRKGGLHHHITVKGWLSAEEAGRTIWHELCHAMQAERTIRAAGANLNNWQAVVKAWNNSPERQGAYRNRPIEVEARSYEPFNDEKPLTLKRGL